MKPETHPDNNNPENVQAADAVPQDAEAGKPGPTKYDNATANAGSGQTAPPRPEAYVDPSIAAEARIAELEAQVAEMQDRYVRSIAENDNLRKRTEREKSDIAKYAVTKFAGDIVAIADNLRRAIEAASATTQPAEETGPLKALLEGIALTDQELQKALEKNGIREIAANGALFDPHKHQAVMEQDDSSVPAGTILKVFQDGYQIEDRVLRPSMVVVAKGGAKPAKSDNEAEQTSEPAGEDGAAAAPQEQADTASHDNKIEPGHTGTTQHSSTGPSGTA